MSGKILIVDDNDQNRLLLGDVLNSCGFTVHLARDGAEGVRMAIEHNPDLVLMDIQMPVMNGLEAGRALRTDPRTMKIRMIALTSYNTLDDKDNFFQTGFDGYLEKPLNIRRLPEIIRSNLPDRGES